MAYPKLKSEEYRQLGGINSKLSPYETGPHQFLDITNFDFQTPGALCKRWGSTMYVGQTFPLPVTDIFEYEQTTGFSQVIIGHTGGLWAGATTGNSQGISALFGATVTFPGNYVVVNTVFDFGGGGRPAFQKQQPSQMFWQDDLEKLKMWPADTIFNPTNLAAYWDFSVVNNALFGVNGFNEIKWNGITLQTPQLPPAGISTNNTNISEFPGTGLFANSSGASAGSSIRIPAGSTGFLFYAQYVNTQGTQGPIFPITYFGASILNSVTQMFFAFGTTLAGTLNVEIYTPSYLGVSAINVYAAPRNDLYAGVNAGPSLQFQDTFSFIYKAPASGNTFTTVNLGFGQSFSFINDLDMFDNTYGIGMTFAIGASVAGGTKNNILYSSGLQPKYIESHISRQFFSGFLDEPNKVVFSEIGKAEVTLPESNFNVVTNNGDYITGLKSFGQKFYIFKKDSFHVLTGDNPDNFTLLEVSLEYGCLSNRAIAVFDDIMLFLDRKGIIRFDGANFTNISTQIEPIFDRMNIDAALGKATMIHDKRRNQILIGIPLDSSTINNATIVYDYDLGSWTKYEGYNPAVFAVVRGRLRDQTAFYGSYSGIVANFGASYLSDNGVAFTCLAKSRFLADMGETTQQMFRRLWLNVEPVTGATSPIGIEFFADYASTPSYTRVMYQTPFQNRIDYGISAKALSVQFTQTSASLPCKIFGYGIASRYLRDV